MANVCILNPKIKDKNGEWKESKLFPEMKRKYGYETAKAIYLMFRGTGFDTIYNRRYPDGTSVLNMDTVGKETIKCNELGEPLLSELEKDNNFKEILFNPNESLKKEAQLNNVEPKEATRDNIDKVDHKVIEYNDSENKVDGTIALTEIYNDDLDGAEKVAIKIVEDNEKNKSEALDIKRKKRLNDRLKNILSNWGVSVGTLSETERLMRINGVTDFEASKLTAEGMKEMIRLAKGRAGEDALPEEFSHIAVEALKDSPLVKRLFDLIDENDLAKEILGEDEYNEYMSAYSEQQSEQRKSFWKSMKASLLGGDSKYNSKENDIKAQVIYEAIGKMVADTILNSYGNFGRTDYGKANGLMARLYKAYVLKFGSMSEAPINEALDELNKSLTEFARNIFDPNNSGAMKKRIGSIASKQKFYQIKTAIDKQKELLDKLIKNSVRQYQVLSVNKSSGEEMESQFQIRTLQRNYDEAAYEAGIYNFADNALEELQNLDTELQDLAAKDLPFNVKANALRRMNNFIKSYAASIDLINTARFNGTIQVSDERTSVLHQISDLVAKLKANYEELANPMFVKYISSFIGDGITVPFGKMKGHKYTAEDIARMADHDISLFDRWLDSMGESGDWVLRMLDSTAKDAKIKAREDVLRIKEDLDSAYVKLKNAGYNDTEFMYRRDSAGNLTGEYISEDEAKMLSAAQQEYWTSIMKIKKKCDNMLPDRATKLQNVVRIRKDFLERVKSKNSRGLVREALESARDMFFRRSDDSEFGGEKSVLMDFDGNQVERLPIYYIKSAKGENLNDLSTDTTSTMLMYADMCCNYHQMGEVLGTLEMVRDNMRRRAVQVTEGGKALKNVIKGFGITTKEDLTKTGDSSNIVARMNDWFSSQVYGKYMKDEGKILGMDIGKLGNFANMVTSLNQFALNFNAGIANVVNGSAMMHIEAAAGQFFTEKELLEADKIFASQLPSFLNDVANPVKSSKMALFLREFNALADHEKVLKEMEYGRNRATRFLSTDSLYIMNNMGELYLQGRHAIAMALHTKVKVNGVVTNLWDAYTTATNKSGLTVLTSKDGITNLDGTPFTVKNRIEFGKRVKAVNQRLFGIYNKDDMSAAQRYALGRMCLMFRKYLKPALNRRYASLKYNFDLGQWEEGFYRTGGRFLVQLAKDLKAANFHLMTRWNELTDIEKSNVSRCLVEFALAISASITFAMLYGLKHGDGDDDDKDNEAFINSWAYSQLLLQSRRAMTDMYSLMPTPSLPSEFFRYVKSPAACITPMQDLLDMTKILSPASWTTEMKSGKYKGHSRAWKYFWDSPLIPMQRTVYKAFHPESVLGFYTANN